MDRTMNASLTCVVFLAIVSILCSRTDGQTAGELPREIISYPDLVLYNGKVLTADDQFTIAEAIAIRDGKFLAVGEYDRIMKMVGPGTARIDLEGRTVLPGFINSHLHLGDSTKDIVSEWLELSDVPNGIREAAREAQPGEWIVKYYPVTVRSKMLGLSREHLDRVAPNNPVIVGAHTGSPLVLNTLALEQVEIPPDLTGIETDAAGEPTGRFGGDAAQYLGTNVAAWVGSMERKIELLRDAITEKNKRGTTTIHTKISADALTALRELWARDELTMRWRVAFTDLQGAEFFKRVGNLTGIGDDMLKIWGINPDGADGRGGNSASGGWTWKPHLNKLSSQLPTYDPRLVEVFEQGPGAIIKLGAKYGWSVVGVHSLGDRATSLVLDAYSEAQKEKLVDSYGQKLRVDHLLVVRDQDIRRMKQLGVIPSVAMWHLMIPIKSLVYANGADEVNNMTKVKSYIDQGLKVVGEMSSACPFWSMEKHITRKDDVEGRIWGREQSVNREQALWMHTNWAAYHGGGEDKLGTIEPGKLADVVVIDGNYMQVPEEEISELAVVMTILGGKIVFDARDSVGYVCKSIYQTEERYQIFNSPETLFK